MGRSADPFTYEIDPMAYVIECIHAFHLTDMSLIIDKFKNAFSMSEEEYLDDVDVDEEEEDFPGEEK